MRLTNYTKFPTERLKEIIRFVKPSNVTKFDISFKNSSNGMKGKAYTQGCSYHDRCCPLVTIGVAVRPPRYPNVTDFGKGYLRSVQFTLEEDVVHLVAHELRHLWQAKVPRGWRVWGARGQYSERDADAYAIRMTRAWRRVHGINR